MRAAPLPPDLFEPACPSSATPFQIGDKWAGMVLTCLRDGTPRRFNELRVPMRQVSAKVLSETLRALERDGMITRHAYEEPSPPAAPPPTDGAAPPRRQQPGAPASVGGAAADGGAVGLRRHSDGTGPVGAGVVDGGAVDGGAVGLRRQSDGTGPVGGGMVDGGAVGLRRQSAGTGAVDGGAGGLRRRSGDTGPVGGSAVGLRRVRVEYAITDLGRTLFPAMDACREWAQRHLAAVESARTAYASRTS
ncbi:winged helix-turn-helix transcriptional regulator [Dactylosporangium sp. NPDC051541]|uniref:winged helix-turn-helix transcriptional regulator n=1 Tax=Dactylosporangium sp. NPDC051541 TaxID=3363977 RepID=UPI0037A91609